ncbi:hypothetical [Yersinia pestis KIM10+]|uniref:Uncharacterized protein n=1 Tax=Yersinia pestis TaxID=632 RepID=Q8CKV8_YERPE|nr:hypothetical [Yersinia pestis KIM10+]
MMHHSGLSMAVGNHHIGIVNLYERIWYPQTLSCWLNSILEDVWTTVYSKLLPAQSATANYTLIKKTLSWCVRWIIWLTRYATVSLSCWKTRPVHCQLMRSTHEFHCYNSRPLCFNPFTRQTTG